MAQKAVLNVQAMNNEETKQKAMKAAAGVCGVESIEAIVKDQKLTVIGLMNILAMVKKLETKVRKVEIILVGPAKEEKDAGSKKDGNEKKSDRRLTMQKAVLKVEAMNNEKTKQKAMKAAAGVCEVELIAANVKDQKLTVIGLMNILAVVKKLEKKVGKVEIILVGPAKEEKKDAGSKKDGNGKQLTMQLVP